MRALAPVATDIDVVALPSVFSTQNRVSARFPRGTSLAEMLEETLPGMDGPARRRSRITINNHVIPPDLYDKVKPKVGTAVIIQVVPGDGSTLRSVLTVVVAIAAVAAGQFYGPGLAAGLQIGGTVGNALASASLIPGATLELDALGQSRDTEATG